MGAGLVASIKFSDVAWRSRGMRGVLLATWLSIASLDLYGPVGFPLGSTILPGESVLHLTSSLVCAEKTDLPDTVYPLNTIGLCRRISVACPTS